MPSPSPAQRAAPPRSWRTRLSALLRKTFGLRRLREGQEAVIASVMAGAPTLALMPTGGGKSLCYQLPALLLPGSTVVVSPLIALMKDQCDKLRELGVAAWQLNSALPAAEIEAAEQAIAAGEAKIVFTTPERLAEPEFLERLAAATREPAGGRRGALHLAMGPRLPAGLPRDRPGARPPRSAAGARPDRDRHRGGERGHRTASSASVASP